MFDAIFGVLFLIYFVHILWAFFGAILKSFLDQDLYVQSRANPAGAFLEAFVVKVLVMGRLGLILGPLGLILGHLGLILGPYLGPYGDPI